MYDNLRHANMTQITQPQEEEWLAKASLPAWLYAAWGSFNGVVSALN